MSSLSIRLSAEAEIQKYADCTPVWLYHICGITLRPPQIVALEEIETHPNTLLVWPPRFGKSFLVELINLKETACNPWEDGRIWGPKVDQARDSLKYQLDAIEASPILRSYIARDKGKRQFSTTGYMFQNGSNWQTFGIQSNFEGVNATIIRGEEMDDMDLHIFKNRVLPRGGAANRNGQPTRIRLTGTIQDGQGNIYSLDTSGDYHVVRKFDVYDGLEIGIYDENIIEQLRKELTDDEWARIFLLEYTENKSFNTKAVLHRAHMAAMAVDWQGQEYIPGSTYDNTGLVIACLDMGHAGQKKNASNYAIHFLEIIGNKVLWLYGQNWPPEYDTARLKSEVIELWSFFRPRYGRGDALNSGLVVDMNDLLYQEHLIRTDRRKFPESTPGNWKKWDFAPVWNTGLAKWQWASFWKLLMEQGRFLMPRFEQDDDRPIAVAGKRLSQQIINIRAVDNKGKVATLEAINAEIGDDDYDAVAMGMGAAMEKVSRIVKMDNIGAIAGRRVTAGLARSADSSPEMALAGDWSDSW